MLAAGEASNRQRPDPLASQWEEKQRSPRLVLTHDDMRCDARGLSEVLKPTRYPSKMLIGCRQTVAFQLQPIRLRRSQIVQDLIRNFPCAATPSPPETKLSG